jgi:hypothetical protein
MQALTRWEYLRAVVAKWIVVKVASRISALAVLSLCLEVSQKYMEQIEAVDE